jgi:hypothetical protein
MTNHVAERGMRFWCATCWTSLALPAAPDDVAWCDACREAHPGSARFNGADLALLRAWAAPHVGPIHGEWVVNNTVTQLHPN